MKELFVVGGDFDTSVLARWEKYGACGNVTRMGSFFRVQHGIIVEMMDTVLDGDEPAANPNSPAYKTVNDTIAATAAARRTAGPPPGGAPAVVPPAGGPSPGASPL